MRDPFAGYDAWLERPHQDAIEEADAFFDWCEDHGMNPNESGASEMYNDWLEGQYGPSDDDYDDYDTDYEDGAYEPWDADMNGEY